MHFKRKLNFKDFKNNKKNSLWSLFWYGKIAFNKNDARFYIEAYFVLLKKDNYLLQNIDKENIEKLNIVFPKSFLFPLCSQFNYEGKLIKISNAFNESGEYAKNGLYHYHVNLINDWKFRISKLDKKLSNTLFPEIIVDNVSLYRDAPYFFYEFNNGNEIIIPIDCVLRYFFGYSSLLLDLLTSNVIQLAISNVSYDENSKTGKLFYDSSLIPRDIVESIAKYFFTENDFAKKMIYKIGNYFYSLKINNNTEGVFIKFKIPFEFECKFSVIGQYFNTNSNIKKFIVNEILFAESLENLDFFQATNGIEIIDICPTKYGDEIDSGGKNIPNQNGQSNNNELQQDSLPLVQNSNNTITQVPVFSTRKCFQFSPIIVNKIRKKASNGDYFYIDDNRQKDHEDFRDKIKDNVNTQNYIKIEWLDIFIKIMSRLNAEYGYEVLLVLDNLSQNYINEKLIYQITFNDANYYIIESGSNYIPLFRNIEKNKKLENDVVVEIINIVENSLNSNWSSIKNRNSLRMNEYFEKLNNDVFMLRPNTHDLHYIDKENRIFDIEITVQNQAFKIHNKILADLNLKKLSKN